MLVSAPQATQAGVPGAAHRALHADRHAACGRLLSVAGGLSDTRIALAFEELGLGHLAGRLDEDTHWEQQMSGGEQQWLALVRVLLQEPDWLFLDEATAGLDEAMEERVYGLIEELGGQPTPGVGWAAGIERILLAAGEAEAEREIDVFVAGSGHDAFVLVTRLRSSGLRAQMEQAGRSLKGQLKQADRLGARWTVILGDEIEVKDMNTGEQHRAGTVDDVPGMVGA